MRENVPKGPRIAVRGQYRLVLNAGRGDETDTGWFDNLITDIGLDRIAQTAGSQILTYASVGTGTTAPANSDTGLQAFLAFSSDLTIDGQANDGPATYESHVDIHHTYAQGAVVGNIAEVGLGWADDGTGLWSRARVLDGGGSPTTITVTSLDQLTVYYRLTMAPDLGDATGTVTLGGVDYDYVGRVAEAASFIGSPYSMFYVVGAEWPGQIGAVAYEGASVLGAITGSPSGANTSSAVGSSAAAAYVSGSKTRSGTLTVAPADANLTAGIGCVKQQFMGSYMSYQYSFDPPIPKDNTMTLTLDYGFSWDRA